MLLTLLIGLSLVGIALALFARAAVFGRIQAEENVGRIAAYGYNRADSGPIAPARSPMFPKLAAWVGSSFAGGALANVPRRGGGLRRDRIHPPPTISPPRVLAAHWQRLLGGRPAGHPEVAPFGGRGPARSL